MQQRSCVNDDLMFKDLNSASGGYRWKKVL